MDEIYKQHIKDPQILDLLRRLKEMPERLERLKLEYYKRKEFVRKVFEKAVKEAFGENGDM
ncbi:MAG TPA: hypothetical protein PKA63_13015 [Oligoflexia bacterium]|nr:hypothetical protein [Oligoflexia bacterium]HMP49580.1 hypothetical protein [Oligoflexia bacterium]